MAKTDPEAVFIVRTVTRRTIADDLNEYLEMHEMPRSVEPDDPRLTDEICKAFADGLGDIDPEALSEDNYPTVDQWVFGEATAAIREAALRAMGVAVRRDQP